MQDNDGIASELESLSDSSLRLITDLTNAVAWHNDLEKITRRVVERIRRWFVQ